MATVTYSFQNFVPEFVVNNTTDGYQIRPDVAVLANGDLFFTFDSGDALFQDVLFRRFDSNGNALDAVDRPVSIGGGSDIEEDAAVVVLSNGNVVVVNEDDNGDPEDDVEFHIFSPAGSNVDTNNIVTQAEGQATDHQIDPVVAALSGGGFVVAYTDEFAGSGTNTNAEFVIYNNDGSFRAGSEIAGGNNTGAPVTQPAVVGLTGGNFVITWTEDVGGGDTNVIFRVYDFMGNGVGAEITANAELDEQYSPALAALPNGGFALTYVDQFSDSTTDTQLEVKFYDALGNQTDAGFINFGTDLISYPDIAVISSNYLLVSYTSDRNGDPDVFAQVFDFSGTKIGEEFDLEATVGVQTASRVAGMGEGRFFAAWHDSQAADADVSGTHVAAQGTEFVRTTISDATSETLTGDDLRDIMAGGGGEDTLNGGAGNDVLNGGAGADTLNGGEGIDTANYEGSSAGVSISLLTGSVGGGHAAGDTFSSIENLFGSTFNDALAGDNVSNVLAGSGGDDLLRGRGGGDTLEGGAGADTADYVDSNAGVSVSLLTGFVAGGHAAGDTFSSIENLTGSAFNDTLAGDNVSNVLTGNGGGDLLRGRGGGDTLDGGAGVDTVDYADSNAGVAVSLLTGFTAGGHAVGDTFFSIENLTGSAFNDTLVGNNASNVLQGLAGNDALNGQGGSDTASYGESNAGVAVSLLTGFVAGGHAPGDTFVSIENLTGSAFADTLVGDNASNVLQGRAGADALSGQGGSDTVTYGDSNAGVAVSLLSGFTAGGHAAGDTFSSIENLTGSAFNDTLVGDNVSNRINGYTGNDTLLGNGGIDRFLFTNNFGQDTITDWLNGELLDFSGSSQVNAFGDLTIGSSAGDAIITDGLGNQITVDGAAGQINAGDFVF